MMGYPLAGCQIGDSLTASGVHYQLSELTHSVFHSNDRSRVFYLAPGIYPPFGSSDFETFILAPGIHNEVIGQSAGFQLTDPFNYDDPNPMPKQISTLQAGANFEDNYFSDPFFAKVTFRGAFGNENWLSGWTNFTPLKTNYNYPR